MALSTETHGDVTVALAPPELADDHVATFAEEVRALINAGRAKLVVRMDSTEFVDGPGLSCLLDLRDEALDAGGAVSLMGVTGPPADALRATRLDRRFEVFADLVPAVGAVR